MIQSGESAVTVFLIFPNVSYFILKMWLRNWDSIHWSHIYIMYHMWWRRLKGAMTNPRVESQFEFCLIILRKERLREKWGILFSCHGSSLFPIQPFSLLAKDLKYSLTWQKNLHITRYVLTHSHLNGFFLLQRSWLYSIKIKVWTSELDVSWCQWRPRVK